MNDEVVMYCNLVWRFSDTLPKNVEKYCKKEFLKLRSELVDILNSGVIDRLNREFDSNHEWYDGIYSTNEYMKHMCDGQREYADLVNRKHLFGLIRLYINDECDICGVFRPTNTTFEIGIINLREEP